MPPRPSLHVLLRGCAPVTARRMASSTSTYNTLLVTSPAPKVTLVQLNRPKQLNALNTEVMHEMVDALQVADADASVGAVVITGNEKAFAAGADIKEMQNLSFSEAYSKAIFAHWVHMTTISKPIIGAVNGYALGGGFELAMMCDILLAGKSAVFGQPEINLGVIPGIGGSQRLTKAIGKSRAMELILTGRNFSAEEAAQWGVVSRVVQEDVVAEAISMAGKIGSKGKLAVRAGKEVVNAAHELSLAEGVRFERKLFHALFATADQKEGMTAFVEKRKASFSDS